MLLVSVKHYTIAIAIYFHTWMKSQISHWLYRRKSCIYCVTANSTTHIFIDCTASDEQPEIANRCKCFRFHTNAVKETCVFYFNPLICWLLEPPLIELHPVLALSKCSSTCVMRPGGGFEPKHAITMCGRPQWARDFPINCSTRSYLLILAVQPVSWE